MKDKVCWGITDGHPGMISQVSGLAEAIGIPAIVKTCERKAPWAWLPITTPFVNPLHHLTANSDTLTPPWPDLLITCGRRQIPYSLWINKLSQGRTFCLHIQNPRISCDYFDMVVAPEHDGIQGTNVISTRGAIHKVTPDKLKQAAKEWAPHFKEYPKPYHVVLLGGSTNRYKMPTSAMDELISQIKNIASQTSGSVLVTPSFRTPYLDKLHDTLAPEDNIYLTDLNAENPYMGMLGLADYIYVTNDSVNMMCEANITGKPLYLLTPQGHEGTVPSKFGETLIHLGIARTYRGTTETWDYEPLNDTTKVARTVKDRLQNE